MVKEKTAQLRKLVKDAGFSNKQVSVRERQGGLSYSYRLVIKDPDIDVNKVRDIADSFKSIDRCQASGEILGGGNTFCFVISETGRIL